MNVMLDIIGSVLVIGILTLTIATMNAGLSTQTYKANNTMQLQFEAIQLARIMEFDVYKAGYKVSQSKRILTADSTSLKFLANLFDTEKDTNTVQYILSSTGEVYTKSPEYKKLVRKIGSDTLTINRNIRSLKFQYYTGSDVKLSTPVTGAWLDSIKSIKIDMTLESFNPLDSTFIAAVYSKWIYPRNL